MRKHRPVYRWLIALGLVLLAGGIGFHWADPGEADVKAVDLTVLREQPDGACTVRWTDPVTATSGRARTPATPTATRC